MNDVQIISLYNSRSEEAVAETKKKYGALVRQIALNVLKSKADAEECENDTYLALWNAIPPHSPDDLRAYTAKTARNLALKKYEYLNAEKRRGGSFVPLDELAEVLSGNDSRSFTDSELHEAMNGFLASLKPEQRRVFLLRYWYGAPISDITERCGISKSKAESMLFRLRKKLRGYLDERGFFV